MLSYNRLILFIIFLVFLIPSLLLAFQPAGDKETKDPLRKKTYTTVRINGLAPTIDGKLDDDAWNQVEWGGDFIQFMPEEKAAPSQQTAFKILYDDKNLYVGIRAYDTDPHKIVKRVGRRDEFDGDWVEINIDSYNDKRTAFSL